MGDFSLTTPNSDVAIRRANNIDSSYYYVIKTASLTIQILNILFYLFAVVFHSAFSYL